MSEYDQALSIARAKPVTVPAFERVAAASDADRERWADEDQHARTRARRWLLFAAALWLVAPWLTPLLPDPFRPEPTSYEVVIASAAMAPMSPVLLWAARACRDRRLRPNVLVRAIAASNLMLALLWSMVPTTVDCVFGILLAVASARSLQLLAARGLDGSDDHDYSFDPVRFRGVLVIALIMACADTVTLLWSEAGEIAIMVADGGYPSWSFLLPLKSLTTLAAAAMAANVWGLLRLRTWALFSSMLTNIAIAAMALHGSLAVGDWVATTLVTTAAIQLLLPLPILATALGHDGARRYTWFGPLLLRGVVPAMVLSTITIAWLHLRWVFPLP